MGYSEKSLWCCSTKESLFFEPSVISFRDCITGIDGRSQRGCAIFSNHEATKMGRFFLGVWLCRRMRKWFVGLASKRDWIEVSRTIVSRPQCKRNVLMPMTYKVLRKEKKRANGGDYIKEFWSRNRTEYIGERAECAPDGTKWQLQAYQERGWK